MTARGSKTSDLLSILEARFRKYPERHKGISWEDVQERLKANPKKLAVLQAMEDTGGEPDVIARDKRTGELTFCDCSAESPSGRRSVCFDDDALKARKEHKPRASALGMAKQMGIEMLDEAQYRTLQQLGEFDTKTSSWIQTPAAIRKLDGALFGDRRYEQVFTYHNGAQSYYAARGFRGRLKV